MDFILSLTLNSIGRVWLTFQHNWPFLALSVALAVLLKLYLDPKRVSEFLLRHQKAGVVGATAVAVGTPLCSCGTTAIVLGMIANYIPWAPIVAFMVSSPLTSPQELVYSAGLFGWRFAIAFFLSSIMLGLAGGVVAGIFDRRGWLRNQVRHALAPAGAAAQRPQPTPQPSLVASSSSFIPLAGLLLEPACCPAEARMGPAAVFLATKTMPNGKETMPINTKTVPVGTESLPIDKDALPNQGTGCACNATAAAATIDTPVLVDNPACGCSGLPARSSVASTGCGCNAGPAAPSRSASLRMVLDEMLTTGSRLLAMFLGFAFIGYFLNGLIPSSWVTTIFGSGNAFSVPLAAVLGLPLYINTEASLPLVRAMLDAGMSQGAALAFLITGAGTSFGAIGGMLTIARWRVVGLVIGTLWAGAVLCGILYNWVF